MNNVRIEPVTHDGIFYEIPHVSYLDVPVGTILEVTANYPPNEKDGSVRFVANIKSVPGETGVKVETQPAPRMTLFAVRYTTADGARVTDRDNDGPWFHGEASAIARARKLVETGVTTDAMVLEAVVRFERGSAPVIETRYR